MRWQIVMGCAITLGVAGCSQKHAVVPEPFEPLVTAQACEEKPPKIVEVAVPIPMPCQLKPAPTLETVSTSRKGKRGKVQAVATGMGQGRMGPADAAWVNSVQQYQYMEGALYQVYASVTSSSVILLQPGEHLTGYVNGDQKRWDYRVLEQIGNPEGAQEGISVGCKFPNTQTNLTLTTDKRLYLLELRCTDGTYNAAVSWEYSGAGGMKVWQAPHQEPLQPVAVQAEMSPDRLNFEYSVRQIKGKDAAGWIPQHVYDDGQKVYIQFPAALAHADAPVLFVRAADGSNAVVNWRPDAKGTKYIVDRLFDEAELRIGATRPVVVRITRNQ